MYFVGYRQQTRTFVAVLINRGCDWPLGGTRWYFALGHCQTLAGKASNPGLHIGSR